jgi:hypothetical protein
LATIQFGQNSKQATKQPSIRESGPSLINSQRQVCCSIIQFYLFFFLMSDFVTQLRRDPEAALRSIKPNNPLLKDIFYAIPEHERQGITLPARGFLIKQWLEDWCDEIVI